MDQSRPQESTVYRRGLKTAVGLGLLYGGYRAYPGIRGRAVAALTRVAAQSPVVTQAMAHWGSGRYGTAFRTIGRGIRSSGWEDFRWATAPVRHAFGAGRPELTRDIIDTTRLLLENPSPINIRPFVSAYRRAGLTRPQRGRYLTVRDVLANNITDVFGKRVDLTRGDYYEDSLRGGLNVIREHVLRIQAAEQAGHLPRRTLASILSVPVDRAIRKTPGGRVVDLRFADPRHWLRNLWHKPAFEIPRGTTLPVPSWIPLVGGEYNIGGTKPLAWLSEMLGPTELLARQPIVRTYRGVGMGGGARRDPLFIYAGGGARRGRRGGDTYHLDIERQVGHRWAPVYLDQIPTEAWRLTEHAGIPFRYTVSTDPIERNARLARAGSAVGKGVRVRTGVYRHHPLDEWLAEHGIPTGSLAERALRWMDTKGIGPHLTSPQVVDDPITGVRTYPKAGGLERLVSKTLNAAYGGGFPDADLPFVAGDLRESRYVTYSSGGGLIERTLGSGRKGQIARGLSDYANYSLLRPMYLLEAGVGLGIRGGTNPIESLWQIMSRVAIPGYLAFQGARYANYAVDQLTPGPSPYDLLLGGYAGLQTVRSKLLEMTGLQEGARRAEDAFPGSMSSPLSWLGRGMAGGYLGARAVGALIGGSTGHPLLGHYGFRMAAPVLGAIFGSFALGSDPIISAESRARQFSGEELVPVRRSRFWELGKDSFFGRDIMYHRPHWLAMQRADTFYASTYGTEADYWKYGTFFPTPSNWFGLRTLMNPYYLESVHEDDRPYPVTGGMFGEVPIVGPLLEGTVGRILKPSYTHPLLDASLREMPPRWSGDRGVPRDVGDRLGLDSLGPEAEETRSRFGIRGVIGKGAGVLQDWLGMQGFLWASMHENMTGNRSLFGGARHLDTSDRMASTEEWFYGMELGGGFQTLRVPGVDLFSTELIRRFIPHRDRTIELVNPIPNNMPEWLPGPRSEFPGDREFYLEGGFHVGDPFTRIPHGAVRLPGPGYESARPLHSGIPGVYDAVDRLIILEDVAPYSESTKHYRAIVETWAKAGALNEYWKRQLHESKIRKMDKDESKQPGTPNLWDAPGTIDMPVTISGVTSPTDFQVAGAPYRFRLAGIERDRDRLIEKQLSDLNAATYEKAEANVRGLQTTLRDRMESLVGQTVNVQIARDQAARYDEQKVLAIVPGLNQEFYNAGLGAEDQGGLTAYLRGGAVTRRAANLYYAAGSTLNQLPGPLAWPANKLLPMKSPVEDYFQFEVLSSRFGKWETPVESFVKPWLRQIPGFFMDYVPGQVEDRRSVDEQFQNLRYVKAARNLELAKQAGDGELMASFRKEMKRSYLGVNPRSPRDAAIYAKLSMDPSEAPYFEHFVDVKSTEERKRILKLVPETTAYVLTNIWAGQAPAGEEVFDEDLSLASRRFDPGAYRQEKLDNFLETTDLPEKDWPGWDPRVSITASKVKWIENRGDNIHNFGLWESDRRRVTRQFPTLQPPDISTGLNVPSRYIQNLSRLGLEQVDMRFLDYPSSKRGGIQQIELRKGRGRRRGYDSSERSSVLSPEP